MEIRYPIAIERGTATTAYGVVVPDLPGCFSAGDTLDEALANAKEAILFYLEDLREPGVALPEPSTLEAFKDTDEYAGWDWTVVRVEVPETNLEPRDAN